MSRKCGRPTKVPPWVDAWLSEVDVHLKTDREKLEWMRRSRAMRLLRDVDETRNLVDFEGIKAGRETWQPTILAELGRIEDDDGLVRVAKRVSAAFAETGSVREAVQLVRQIRGARRPRPKHDQDGLVGRLIEAIDSWRVAHQGCTLDNVILALEQVRDVAVNLQGEGFE